MIDLAGSERLKKSEATDARRKETQAINQSLSCLGNVFVALGKKSKHIPYRDSTLTRLLQPCLGGNGKTLMMLNLSPAPSSYQESKCSLEFASRVNAVEMGHKGRGVRLQTTIPSFFTCCCRCFAHALASATCTLAIHESNAAPKREIHASNQHEDADGQNKRANSSESLERRSAATPARGEPMTAKKRRAPGVPGSAAGSSTASKMRKQAWEQSR